MADRRDIIEELAGGAPAASEVPGFKPGEMVECGKCARKNPPTRAACFYCGEGLAVSAERIAAVVPKLRPMEAWEKGFNVILLNENTGQLSEDSVRGGARTLKMEAGDFKTMLAKGVPLPVARTSTATEAGIIEHQLSGFGFATALLPDEEIAPATAPHRLRGMAFDDETVTFYHFNTGEALRLKWADVTLVVTGSLFDSKKESTERYAKKEKDRKVTSVAEIVYDQPAVDIYGRTDAIGCRVTINGFDFSFLGAQKTFLAVENIKRLVELFRARASSAVFDENYLKVRKELNVVWPLEEKLESQKMQREGMGKFNLDQVKNASNNDQFTRYSRMRRKLIEEA